MVPYEKSLKIVARVSNRVFVGLPQCTHCRGSTNEGRNEEYLRYAVQNTMEIAKAAFVLNFVPEFLKPYGVCPTKLIQGFGLLISRSKKIKKRVLQAPYTDNQRTTETSGRT